ncbi:acyl-ACP desaturase [Chondromyces apiculatus]|nr:acyl-ACP desaturase [Chondromyces apiculatus]
MATSGKVDLSDVPWEEVRDTPLTPEALRTLRYFLITEGSTFFYTKALMKTNTAVREPEFIPFITAWLYEEEFHGRAFRRFLEAWGEDIGEDYRNKFFRKRAINEYIDELGQKVISHVFADSFPALHMVWGTIQELTTYSAYQALIERVNHPVLTTICQRIMKQELRHYAFYRHNARRFLASKSAQQVTSTALKISWTPVGDGMCPTAEACHVLRFLFDGADGSAIPKIEAKIRELPGLEWFDLFTRYVRDHHLTSAPQAWMPRRAESRAAAIQAASL